MGHHLIYGRFFTIDDVVVHLLDDDFDHCRNRRGDQHAHGAPDPVTGQQGEHDGYGMQAGGIALHLGNDNIAFNLLHHQHENSHGNAQADSAGNGCHDGFHNAGKRRTEIGDEVQHKRQSRKQRSIRNANDAQANVRDGGHTAGHQNADLYILPHQFIALGQHMRCAAGKAVRQDAQKAAHQFGTIQHQINDDDNDNDNVYNAEGKVDGPRQEGAEQTNQHFICLLQIIVGQIQHTGRQTQAFQILVNAFQQFVIVGGGCVPNDIIHQLGDFFYYGRNQQIQQETQNRHSKQQNQGHCNASVQMQFFTEELCQRAKQVCDQGRCEKFHNNIPKAGQHQCATQKQQDQHQRFSMFHGYTSLFTRIIFILYIIR